MAGDGEARATTPAGPISLIESLKDTRKIVRREAHTGILDGDDYFIFCWDCFGVDPNRTPGRGELYGVVDQIGDDTLDTFHISHDGGKVSRQVHIQVQFRPHGLGTQTVQRRENKVTNGGRFHL